MTKRREKAPGSFEGATGASVAFSTCPVLNK